MSHPSLSIVIPVYNEAANIRTFYEVLAPIADKTSGRSYEIIYVDDGSDDESAALIESIRRTDKNVKLLGLSRNFGKEIALAAGIAHARGEAILMIDGDGQHPAERIPEFVSAWRQKAQVVIGVRTANQGEGFVKKYGSRLFYRILNALLGVKMVPGSSDFRLIDREVQQEFMKLNEPQTMTRGLIDWLGFERVYVPYAANPRTAGEDGYKFKKLVRLAAHSFVSLSPVPLYAFGYLGVVITGVSLVLGLSILVEQIILGDPWAWDFTGTAMLSILVIFLVGLVLVAQGVLALYISYIYTQSKGRPLFVVNKRNSRGIKTDGTP